MIGINMLLQADPALVRLVGVMRAPAIHPRSAATSRLEVWAQLQSLAIVRVLAVRAFLGQVSGLRGCRDE